MHISGILTLVFCVFFISSNAVPVEKKGEEVGKPVENLPKEPITNNEISDAQASKFSIRGFLKCGLTALMLLAAMVHGAGAARPYAVPAGPASAVVDRVPSSSCLGPHCPPEHPINVPGPSHKCHGKKCPPAMPTGQYTESAESAAVVADRVPSSSCLGPRCPPEHPIIVPVPPQKCRGKNCPPAMQDEKGTAQPANTADVHDDDKHAEPEKEVEMKQETAKHTIKGMALSKPQKKPFAQLPSCPPGHCPPPEHLPIIIPGPPHKCRGKKCPPAMQEEEKAMAPPAEHIDADRMPRSSCSGKTCPPVIVPVPPHKCRGKNCPPAMQEEKATAPPANTADVHDDEKHAETEKEAEKKQETVKHNNKS